MHSRISNRSTRYRRLTPYLITVGVGFSMASGAAAAVQDAPEEPLESEIPAPTIDTDGDGVNDAWDRSGDGKPDAWDTDGDGKPDLLDDDADGQPD